MYNVGGNIVSRSEYVYDAWGNCTVKADTNGYGSRNPFRYRGYYWDSDLAMYYLITRYYDPAVGRFISADNLNYLEPGVINGLNLYAYCGNNPIKYVDPSGCFPWLALAVLLLFTPVGGFAVQATISTVAFAGIAIASLFDKDIKNDMDNIGWNIFNSDADKASNSNKVSFYRGVPVFMVDGVNGSFSFGVIGLHTTYHRGDVDVLKHERGHSTQLMFMGPIKYGLFVAIPSPLKNDDVNPWELSASLLGGSNLGDSEATMQDKIDAMKYYFYACSNNPILWAINIWDFLSRP